MLPDDYNELIVWGNNHPKAFQPAYFKLSDEDKIKYIKSYEAWEFNNGTAR